MSVVGRSPAPRPGGLHHVCGSGYFFGGGVHEPWPFLAVSTTKWGVVAGSTFPSDGQSLTPVARWTLMQADSALPYATLFCVGW